MAVVQPFESYPPLVLGQDLLPKNCPSLDLAQPLGSETVVSESQAQNSEFQSHSDSSVGEEMVYPGFDILSEQILCTACKAKIPLAKIRQLMDGENDPLVS
jgi:hypothetical protein